MSKEAMKYVKTLEVNYFVTKTLLLAIARRTFNDSGLCRCGQTSLMSETGLCSRTVVRHLNKLRQLGIITCKKRPGAGLGRLNDDIEIVGFKAWLNNQVGDTTGQSANCHLWHLGQPDSEATSNVTQQSPIYKEVENTRKTNRQDIYHDRYIAKGADTTQNTLPPQAEVTEDDWDSLVETFERLERPDGEVLQ